jgi:hypothetical protein
MLLYRSLIAFGRAVLFYFIVASFVSPGWAKQKKQQRESRYHAAAGSMR